MRLKPSRGEPPRKSPSITGRLPIEARLLLVSMTIVSVAGLLVFELGL